MNDLDVPSVSFVWAQITFYKNVLCGFDMYWPKSQIHTVQWIWEWAEQQNVFGNIQVLLFFFAYLVC